MTASASASCLTSTCLLHDDEDIDSTNSTELDELAHAYAVTFAPRPWATDAATGNSDS